MRRVCDSRIDAAVSARSFHNQLIPERLRRYAPGILAQSVWSLAKVGRTFVWPSSCGAPALSTRSADTLHRAPATEAIALANLPRAAQCGPAPRSLQFRTARGPTDARACASRTARTRTAKTGRAHVISPLPVQFIGGIPKAVTLPGCAQGVIGRARRIRPRRYVALGKEDRSRFPTHARA